MLFNITLRESKNIFDSLDEVVYVNQVSLSKKLIKQTNIKDKFNHKMITLMFKVYQRKVEKKIKVLKNLKEMMIKEFELNLPKIKSFSDFKNEEEFSENEINIESSFSLDEIQYGKYFSENKFNIEYTISSENIKLIILGLKYKVDHPYIKINNEEYHIKEFNDLRNYIEKLSKNMEK